MDVLCFHVKVEQVQHPCECHVCNQGGVDGGTAGLGTAALPPRHLHTAPHQFFTDKSPAHPALHLYPHIHGHLPMHNLPHLPRPLLPTLYSSPPLSHSKVRHSHMTHTRRLSARVGYFLTCYHHVYLFVCI